jgi:hypothetical protein
MMHFGLGESQLDRRAVWITGKLEAISDVPAKSHFE